MVYAMASIAGLAALAAAFWFANPFGMRDTLMARMIVNMRVAPARLDNPKTPADYGVDVAPRLATLKVVEPPKRQGGGKVADVKELVAKLRNEAKVIS